MALTKITRGVIKANENYDTHNINSTGIVTAVSANFTGNVSIGGTLTYQDVTNIDSVGIITAQSDISIADKIVHTGDTNTALRFPAADTITAETGGTERLRITSGGNIGIGTDNPIERLHLIGGSSSSAGTQVDIMRLVASDFSPTNSGGLTIGAVWHNTDVSRRVSYLQSSQNLNSGSTNRALCLNPNGGTIGIGTDDPNRLLHIKGASSTAYSGGSDTADYNFLKIENTTNDKSAGVFFLIGSNGEAAITATEVADGNTDIVFQNRGGGVRSEKVRITSDGKVGINDTNPSYHLSIEGTGAVRNEITCTDNSVAGAGVYFRTMNGGSMVSNATIRTDNAGNLQFYTGTSSDSEKLRIASDGKVHIGGNGTGTDQLNIIGAGNGINISRANSGSPSVNEWLGAVGFKGYATGNSSSGADARIHAVASHNHSGSSSPASLIFSTKPTTTGPGSSPTERMRITYDGYVLKSNHPCFDAVRSSGHLSATTYITYNTVKANNGGHYNSSNGRFTAPVAGYYFFSWTSIKNGTNAVTRLYIHKNGSAPTYGNRHLRLDAGQDYGDNGTMTAVIQLAANDYIQIYLQAGSIYGATEEYCIFNGYLLG